MSSKQRPQNKELRAFLRAIELAGGRVVLGGQGHWKVFLDKQLITSISSSSSDWRSRRNALAVMRRAGLDVRL